MRANAGVEADALDDGGGVETLHLGIRVELIEIADAEGEVRVGEELDGFGFLHSHEERVDVGLEGAFLQEPGKDVAIGLGIRMPDGADGGVLLVEI